MLLCSIGDNEVLVGRKAFNARGAAAIGPYSHAVESHGFLILSGQTPLDPATGRLTSGTLAQQTRQCIQNLSAVLEAAGLTLDDVVSVQAYLIDMADFPEMNAEYARHFNAPYPARTTIGCASLPLGDRDGLHGRNTTNHRLKANCPVFWKSIHLCAGRPITIYARFN